MPERAAALVANLEYVQEDIFKTASAHDVILPRLVAVSKTKPATDIADVYAAGHRHFGENYVQELVEKSLMLPEDIKWHYIGTLQSGKCKILAGIESLWAVETVDSEKKASSLSTHRAPGHLLRVFVQVNTSGEEAKSGVTPERAIEIAMHIRDECPNLIFAGLMTIGAAQRDIADGEDNPDFTLLTQVRDRVAEALGIPPSEIELSMGMSGDYALATRQGSTNVRVGSLIFGPRLYPKSS